MSESTPRTINPANAVNMEKTATNVSAAIRVMMEKRNSIIVE